MTFIEVISLFTVMFLLAAIPGISVLTVSARAAACGFRHGIAATLGIVAGDIVFIAIAIFGLSVLAESMGNLFALIKYLGAAWLIWLGISLWRSKTSTMQAEEKMDASLPSSFMSGLLITLGDQKAILFYLGFFPAFVDLSALSYADAGTVILLAALAISLAKLWYAFMAVRAVSLINSRSGRILNMAAGTIMIAIGILLVANTSWERLFDFQYSF